MFGLTKQCKKLFTLNQLYKFDILALIQSYLVDFHGQVVLILLIDDLKN